MAGRRGGTRRRRNVKHNPETNEARPRTLRDLERDLLADPAFRLAWEEREMAREIAALLRAMRRHAGLTQVQLAEKVGVPQSVVARLESRSARRLPRLDTLARVAEALGRRLVLQFEPEDEAGGGRRVRAA